MSLFTWPQSSGSDNHVIRCVLYALYSRCNEKAVTSGNVCCEKGPRHDITSELRCHFYCPTAPIRALHAVLTSELMVTLVICCPLLVWIIRQQIADFYTLHLFKNVVTLPHNREFVVIWEDVTIILPSVHDRTLLINLNLYSPIKPKPFFTCWTVEGDFLPLVLLLSTCLNTAKSICCFFTPSYMVKSAVSWILQSFV